MDTDPQEKQKKLAESKSQAVGSVKPRPNLLITLLMLIMLSTLAMLAMLAILFAPRAPAGATLSGAVFAVGVRSNLS